MTKVVFDFGERQDERPYRMTQHADVTADLIRLRLQAFLRLHLTTASHDSDAAFNRSILRT